MVAKGAFEFCSLNCATTYIECANKPANCDFCHAFLARPFLLNKTRDFLFQVQSIEDNLTELPLELTSEEIDRLIQSLNIDPQRMEAMSHSAAHDSAGFPQFVQQALKQSLESLLNDFFKKDREEMNENFAKLRSNIEHIKNDFELKMYIIAKKFKRNQENITELATLKSASSALESRSNLLDNLAKKVNAIEENMQEIGQFVKSFQNYTVLLDEFDSRLKALENVAQQQINDTKISQLIDEKVGKILTEKSNESLKKEEEEKKAMQRNITDLVNSLNSKLLEVEAKLANFQENFTRVAENKPQVAQDAKLNQSLNSDQAKELDRAPRKEETGKTSGDSVKAVEITTLKEPKEAEAVKKEEQTNPIKDEKKDSAAKQGPAANKSAETVKTPETKANQTQQILEEGSKGNLNESNKTVESVPKTVQELNETATGGKPLEKTASQDDKKPVDMAAPKSETPLTNTTTAETQGDPKVNVTEPAKDTTQAPTPAATDVKPVELNSGQASNQTRQKTGKLQKNFFQRLFE